ncbi:Uncharacterised protein [Enterobacter cloacae]|nr:Uncharacterised protein [Enterobacter cloacae]
MMPSGSARKNGIRQPQSRKFSSPTTVEIRTTTPAPMTKPAIEPKSSQLPIKPRLRSGEYSATKIDAPVYSPPTEKPCAILQINSRIGAHIPIVAYDGIRPIQNVLIDMMTMVIARIFWRPYLSPSMPKKRPPRGRIRKGTENVPSAAIICKLGSAPGKNTLPSA